MASGQGTIFFVGWAPPCGLFVLGWVPAGRGMCCPYDPRYAACTVCGHVAALVYISGIVQATVGGPLVLAWIGGWGALSVLSTMFGIYCNPP